MKETQTQPHPAWKNAVETILKEYGTQGYGTTYSHNELCNMFFMKMPNEAKSYDEMKKLQIEYMFHIQKIKDVLQDEHHLYFDSVRGVGYEIRTPDFQVEHGTQKHMNKAKKQMVKATKCLINVDQSKLSTKSKLIRDNFITRVAFVSASFKTRLSP